jgi:hypothetical protein
MTDRLWMRHWAWTQRLLLAQLTGDAVATELVIDEVGDCPHCWRLVAAYAVGLAADGWFSVGDNDAIIDSLCAGIGYALDRLDQEGESA